MSNIFLWGVWGVCQPLTWTNNQTSDCPQARVWICCFDLAFCSPYIYVWIGKPTVFSSCKALVQWLVQLKDFYTISVQYSSPSRCIFFIFLSLWVKQSGIWTVAEHIWSDSVGSGETFMQGKAAVCVLLLTLVSCKTLGTGTRDKRNVWVWERQIFFSLLFFLWGGFFFSFLFSPQTWLAAKNWNKNEEQGLFIWALI